MTTRYRGICDDCGYDRMYSSEPRAWQGLDSHSCARQLNLAASRARGEARMAAVDRTPKPCLHKVADHQHGTYACYVLDGCRCLPCAAAKDAWRQNRERQQAYGRWTHWVDPAPARAHVIALTDQGMGLRRIANLADVDRSQLWFLLHGKPRRDGTHRLPQRIHRDTEAAILAVTFELAGGSNVDATGTVRRVQALVALGWSQAKIAHRLGVLPRNFFHIVHGRRSHVLASTRDAVRALYDELSMQLPPTDNSRDRGAATLARKVAQENGWLPPLAWDDDAIDDPAATPLTGDPDDSIDAGTDVDEAAVARRIAGDRVHLNTAERAEVIRRMQAAGWTLAAIERHTGLNVHRYREAS